jgi:predicted permease
MGLPLCLFAFGQAGFGYAIILFSVTSVFAFSIGIYVITGGTSLRKLAREPLVLSTLLGLVFLVQGWQLPEFLANTINLVGGIGIPIMLITLGVAVARLKPANIVNAIWLSAAKIAICTGIAILVGAFFDLPDVAYSVLILQMSAPVAVTSYLLAERFKVDADAVAGLVVVSTVMTIGVAPLVLSFVLV